MHPHLFNIPILNFPISTYGFFVLIGVAGGVYIAVRRARRLKANPDVMLSAGFVAVMAGLFGGRLFYVLHYWETHFANLDHPIATAFNFTTGGTEVYGGMIAAVIALLIYLAVKRVSARLYMDILAPSFMWGQAFGRVGCFLFGCCFGGLCLQDDGQKSIAWGVEFPFGSPAHVHHWEQRCVTVPAELIYIPPAAEASLVSRTLLASTPQERQGPARQYEEARREYEAALARGADRKEIDSLKRKLNAMERLKIVRNKISEPLNQAMEFPSREEAWRDMTPSELQRLATKCHALPIHPVQLYASLNGLLLFFVLSEVLKRRKRHGMVLAVLLLTYPWTRILQEVIRSDNPHDAFGVTAATAISLGIVLVGIIYVIVLRRLPLRSPLAVPYVPPAKPDENEDREAGGTE